MACAACRAYGAAAWSWFNETTEVQILGSPWVRRRLGRVIRFVWMVLGITGGLLILARSPPEQTRMLQNSTLIYILSWYFWTASLWHLWHTSWESFSGSLQFSLGVLASITLFAIPDSNDLINTGDIFTLTFLLLSQCSVHPVAMFPVLLPGLILTAQQWDIFIEGLTMDPVFPLMLAHSQVSLVILFAAFTLDFTGKVRHVSIAMMTEGEVPVDEELRPTHSLEPLVWQCCFAAGLNNWIFWIAFLRLKRRNGAYDVPVTDPRFLWQDHLPKLTLALPFLGVLSLVLLLARPGRHRHVSEFAMAMFVALPATSLVLDWEAAIRRGLLHPNFCPYFYTFVRSIVSFSYMQYVISMQILTQARCHPVLCILVTIPLLGTLVADFSAELGPATPRTGLVANSIFFSEHFLCFIISMVTVMSHSADFYGQRQGLRTLRATALSLSVANTLELADV